MAISVLPSTACFPLPFDPFVDGGGGGVGCVFFLFSSRIPFARHGFRADSGQAARNERDKINYNDGNKTLGTRTHADNFIRSSLCFCIQMCSEICCSSIKAASTSLPVCYSCCSRRSRSLELRATLGELALLVQHLVAFLARHGTCWLARTLLHSRPSLGGY